MENKIPHGVKKDARPETEKSLDYKHESLYAGLSPQWVPTPESQWKRYTQRNQNGSFSCCMQSGAKGCETLNNKVMSAIEYQWRPGGGEGMILKNVGDIFYDVTKGLTTEVLAPSQNMSDPQMDAAKIPKTYFNITGYRTFSDPTNIDSIAQAVEGYKHCLVTFESNEEEWDHEGFTPLYVGTPVTFGHCICAVDFVLINGIKTLVCEDSSGQWSSPDGLRLITEDFLKKRATGALYFTGTVDGTPTVAPQTPVTETISTANASIHTTAPQGFFDRIMAWLRAFGVTYTETKD